MGRAVEGARRLPNPAKNATSRSAVRSILSVKEKTNDRRLSPIKLF
jgi:hypothetical protein